MITIVTNNRKNMNYNQRKEKEKHIMQVKKNIFILLKEPKVKRSFTGGLGKGWVVPLILNNVTRFCVQTHNIFIFANH